MRDIGLVNFNEPVKRLADAGNGRRRNFFDVFRIRRSRIKSKRFIFRLDDVDGRARRERQNLQRAEIGRRHRSKSPSKECRNRNTTALTRTIWSRFTARTRRDFSPCLPRRSKTNSSGRKPESKARSGFCREFVVLFGNGRASFARQRIANHEPKEFSAERTEICGRKLIRRSNALTENFETLQFNTPVAALMELSNAIYDFKVEPKRRTNRDVYAVSEAWKV